MSTIAEISEHRLDLNYIWNALILQPELEAHIQRAVGRAQKHLMQNQTKSWARSVACWNDMKDSLEDAIKLVATFLRRKERLWSLVMMMNRRLSIVLIK